MKRYPDSSAGHITGRILLKKLVPLFAALLVVGCGEKSSSEGSDSAGASAEPPADAVKPGPTESPGKEPSPPSLSDADIERLLKEAVDSESLPERDGLIYHDNTPYSGWGKEMYDSDQAFRLVEIKDGKPNGLMIEWYENGQKSGEGTLKDGKPDGLVIEWHENGQKDSEAIYRNGRKIGLETTWHENGQKKSEITWKAIEKDTISLEVSVKYWNSKGEPVDSIEEARK